jgi:hypothetical protein
MDSAMWFLVVWGRPTHRSIVRPVIYSVVSTCRVLTSQYTCAQVRKDDLRISQRRGGTIHFHRVPTPPPTRGEGR